MGIQKAVRVRLTRQVDLSPYAILAEGEKGTIVGRGEAHTDVKMDVYHEGLAQWHNEAPLGDEDLSGLSPLRFQWLEPTLKRLAIVAVCVLALNGAIGFAAEGLEDTVENGVSWLVHEVYPMRSAGRLKGYLAP